MKKSLLLFLLPAMLIASCSKQSDDKPNAVINKSTVELNYDKEEQFSITQGSAPVEASSLKWTSSDESVGVVETSGLFKAKKIGKTTVSAVGNGINVTAEVTVVPYSNLAKEPVLDFGSSISAIKSKETRTISAESSSAVLYKGESSKVRNVFYTFTNGAMDNAILMLANTNAVIEESVTFLKERYIYNGSSNNIYFFSDNNVTIGLSYDATFGFNALYIKNTTGVSASSNIQTIQKMIMDRKSSIQLKSIK